MDNGVLLQNEGDLIKEHSQLVRSCIRPYFLKGGDYDDLYQEGMIGLLSAVRTYDARRSDNFKAYAALCIKRRVIDAVRKDILQNQHNEYSEEALAYHQSMMDTAGSLSDPEVTFLANETAKEIRTALSGMLSAFEASVLDRYLDGYTSSEIAEMLNRNRKSVDNAIRRVKTKAAQYLSEWR
ncbi:MAG: sigma-70 family RNA polymerase sigma factor [Clostridia bacterium]|nr:sigma-70 family RNA polymerase sigma factor [Clostridia bacterium]MBQ5812877.1 sigma-70 family RNA polymerase sigma factor [Clostridia bacterium]